MDTYRCWTHNHGGLTFTPQTVHHERNKWLIKHKKDAEESTQNKENPAPTSRIDETMEKEHLHTHIFACSYIILNKVHTQVKYLAYLKN